MKSLLIIDGGGVRGLFDLYIINSIEAALGTKLRNIFDMAIGVSAGAATAALVATGMYNDIRNLSTESYEAFEGRQRGGPIFRTKYTGKGKRKFFKKIFGQVTLGEVSMPLMILTAHVNGTPIVLSSENAKHKNIPLWLAVDASTAAPTYFPPVEIDGDYFMDGGVISNDPVLAGIVSAVGLWPNSRLSVLSLGTGINKLIDIKHPEDGLNFGLLRWLQEGLLSIITQGNDQLYQEIIPLLLPKDSYLRITSSVVSDLDDTSPQVRERLIEDANTVWEKFKDVILYFIKEKMISVSSKVK